MSAAELDLDAIEARASAATPGPWTAGHAYYADRQCALASLGTYSVLSSDHGHEHRGEAFDADAYHAHTGNDAAFVAHARTDVPALIAEVRRLRTTLRASRPPCRICERPRVDHGSEDDGIRECGVQICDGYEPDDVTP